MNVSFSTRGWQDKPWETWLDWAETMRFGGIELYNVQNCPQHTDRGGALHKYATAATVRALREKNLRIPCLDTSCDISSEDCTETVRGLIQLAHDIQCPNVCVAALHEGEKSVVQALRVLIPEAESAGVTILLKTSGIFADTARLRAPAFSDLD